VRLKAGHGRREVHLIKTTRRSSGEAPVRKRAGRIFPTSSYRSRFDEKQTIGSHMNRAQRKGRNKASERKCPDSGPAVDKPETAL